MAVAPRQRPVVRMGQTYSCFRMTIILVLCSGWTTLHCLASPLSSRSVGQPRMSNSNDLVMDIPEWPLDLFSIPQYSPSNKFGYPGEDFYFIRNNRDSSTDSGTRYCLNRLRDALEKICNGSFHSPTNGKRSLKSGKRNVFVFRRVQRAVVSECCGTPCTDDTMKKYCKHGMEPESPVPFSSARFANPSEEFPEVTENAVNKITSTPTPTSIPEPTEPAIFSLIRLIKYLVSGSANNQRPQGSSSGESNVGIIQSRQSKLLNICQAKQKVKKNSSV